METFDHALANWLGLSRLLDEALELPPHELPAWMAALPARYQEWKPDLERMLALSAGQALAGDLPKVADIDDGDPAHHGETAGPWRLLRKIGEGGMAAVWEAERHDGLFLRRVAIKLPRHGWPGEVLGERIAREREILARLNHPNIARLLDAGTTSAGQPYLALEYVEGKRIDQHCREHSLPLRERLQLFLQVARAIAYAHTMLVLHRDLKPSNILVAAGGEVRVLDFGIAKMLEPGETRETELTRVSGRALTLDYASPEQIRGEPLTVASDIYSLGVVLHELLTGASPYRPSRQSRAALEEAILDADPRPASEAVSGRAMQKALRGDLDTIVLKALKKHTAERYPSVERMAEDIERFLDNRPVLARPDRLSYRVAKFMRRNRLRVCVAGAVAGLLLAGAVTIQRQSLVSRAQKEQIAAARWFVVPLLLEAHAYNRGRPLSALQLLEQLAQRVDRMQDAGATSRVELLNVVAASLIILQDTARSEAIARKAVVAAAALDPVHPQSLRARMLMSWVRLIRGQTAELRRETGALLTDMRRSSRALPEDLPGALRIRSAAAREEGDSEDAETSAREALSIAESRLGRLHDQAILSLVDLCYAYESGGKAALAVETGSQARERAMSAYSGRRAHPNVLKAREAYALALASSGQSAAGIREMNDAIRDTSFSFGASSRSVGFALRRLARMQLAAGRAGQALESVDRAISILSEHVDKDSPVFARTMALRGRIVAAAQPPVVRITAGR